MVDEQNKKVIEKNDDRLECLQKIADDVTSGISCESFAQNLPHISITNDIENLIDDIKSYIKSHLNKDIETLWAQQKLHDKFANLDSIKSCPKKKAWRYCNGQINKNNIKYRSLINEKKMFQETVNNYSLQEKEIKANIDKIFSELKPIGNDS